MSYIEGCGGNFGASQEAELLETVEPRPVVIGILERRFTGLSERRLYVSYSKRLIDNVSDASGMMLIIFALKLWRGSAVY